MPSTTKTKSAKSAKSTKIVGAITFILLIVLGIFFAFNRSYISDFISAKSYSAPAAVAELESHLGLTGRASTMFYATHPSLETYDNFNLHCDSHDEQTSVLGCYTNGKIYIYNIEESELAGVRESTIAHELLHAAWQRLSGVEKSKLSAALMDVYNSPEHHELLSEDLESYDESDRIDELHSRIGTEIANLPEILEDHYAKYFTDQDLIVKFYDSYITPFKELSEEIDQLSEKLEKLNSEIEQKTKAYYKAVDALTKEINEFNKCANKPNCFTTEAAFYEKRSALVAKQTALDEDYDALDRLINNYNKLVEEYNDNIIRSETLESAINSNSKVNKVN